MIRKSGSYDEYHLEWLKDPENAAAFLNAFIADNDREAFEGTDDSITAEEFFDKHFAGQSGGAVALKGYRYRENLTQAQLAELTGIPQRHISEMENSIFSREIPSMATQIPHLYNSIHKRSFLPQNSLPLL